MSEKVANFEGPCDLRGSAEPSARCGFNKRGQRVEGPRHCTYGGTDPSTMWSSAVVTAPAERSWLRPGTGRNSGVMRTLVCSFKGF